MRAMKKNATLASAIRRSLPGLVVAGAAVMLLGGGSLALASSPATTTVTACYKTSQSVAALSRIGGGNCPAGDTKVSWSKLGPAGPQGPAGPAGVAVGLIASSEAQMAMTGSWEGVLSSPAVPQAGEYYVTASVVAFLNTGDSIQCRVEGSAAPPSSAGGASPVTLPVVAEVSALAGQRIVVQCIDSTGSSVSGFYSGTIQAILVSGAAG